MFSWYFQKNIIKCFINSVITYTILINHYIIYTFVLNYYFIDFNYVQCTAKKSL